MTFTFYLYVICSAMVDASIQRGLKSLWYREKNFEVILWTFQYFQGQTLLHVEGGIRSFRYEYIEKPYSCSENIGYIFKSQSFVVSG